MDKKIKIAFLSQYIGSVNRGAETYVIELSKRLQKKFDVEILIGKDSFSYKKMVSRKYDFVIPTNGRRQALVASLAKIRGGFKTIISGQAGIGKDDIWNILVTAPDYYIALTEHEKNWAKKFAWKTKVLKIPNGVDLEKFSPNGSKVKFNASGKVVLSVGALYWYKHHERSIKAISMIRDTSLVIVGSGPENEKLSEMGKDLLGERFQIIHADYNELPKYYRSADLFVLPSWDREAFGIVYLEAMSSGLPIVAPDDSPRHEIIGDAGIFVDTQNPEKYAKAIEEALNKKWRDIPRHQAEKFSWDLVAEQYEELIKGS